MSKPKIRGHRPGGRNKQFFEGLSGLARGLDAAIENNRAAVTTPAVDAGAEKLREAEEKRRRKAERRLRDVR